MLLAQGRGFVSAREETHIVGIKETLTSVVTVSSTLASNDVQHHWRQTREARHKVSLSENIRSLRKQRKITQAKLAEALGVTVGAVYKWESGQSLPELNLVVEMADFFDISVDVLLGYRMRDNSLGCALERILGCCKTLDPTALTEAEKTLARYPHSFRVVYTCASAYLAFGASGHDPHARRGPGQAEQG